MTVDTMTFTADDVALAIANMTEAATDDIEYVSRSQMDADMTTVAFRVKNEVGSVMKLHGVSPNGDSSLGDPAAAEAIRREVERYRADPDAYIDSIDAQDDDDDVRDVPTQTAPAIPLPSVPAEQDFTLPPMAAPPPTVPLEKLKYIERAAKGLFPGISDMYATERVRTVKWGAEKPHIAEPDKHYSFDGFSVKVLNSAMRRRKNVIAVGDPGCGKTEFFKQFAARTGLPYHGITFDGQLSRAEIIGSFRQIATPTGSATPFVLGLIPTLIQRPGILCLNEIDQCDPDIQYMLHDMYEGGGLTIQEDGGRFIDRHPDCFIVATANTKGRGSDNGLTNAKFEMSEATRDRYPIWLNFTYLPEDKEAETIVGKTTLSLDLAKSLVGIGTAIRNGYKNGDVAQPCSLRQLLDAGEMAEDFMSCGPKEALAIACDIVIAGRANDDDTMQIREYVKQKLAVDLNKMER